MNLLDRYISGQFIRNLLLIMGAFIAIYLVIDFFERLDLFNQAGKSIGFALHYFLLKIPAIGEQMLPISLLLAGVVTLGILNHNRELTALKAGGISVSRIFTPVLTTAVLIILAGIAARQWLLPQTVAAANRIWYEEVQNSEPKGVNRNGHNFYRGAKGVYSFTDYFQKQNRFTGFSYAGWEDYRLRLLLTAKEATWQNNAWIFSQGQLKVVEQDGYQVTPFERLEYPLPESPEHFFFLEYRLEEMSLSQLFHRARMPVIAADHSATLEFHQRLSYNFLGLPLLLLGLPILLLGHQKWRKDLSLAIPLSCVIAFTAWGWWAASQSLARAAYLPPVLASWSIHLLVGALGVILIRQQDR